MSQAHRITQARAQHQRTNELTAALATEALAFAKTHGGYSGDNPLRYPFAFERVCNAAAARIAELEAWIQMNALALPESVIAQYLSDTKPGSTTEGSAGRSGTRRDQEPAPLHAAEPGERPGREAHSHATRGSGPA